MEKDIKLFREGFGIVPKYKIVTPSRVNIIGEHSDYFDNFVLSIAVENLSFNAFVAPREDDRIRVLSLNLKNDEKPFFEFSTKDDRYKTQWIQYLQGAIAMYAEEFRRRNLKGFDMMIDSTIPVGGGLSSSSALTMTALAALGLSNGFTDGDNDYSAAEGMSMINLKADNATTQNLMKKFFMMGCWSEYWYGTRGGFNDHLAIACGKKLNATLSDNRHKSFQYSPIPADVAFVVCNTMVKHNQLFSEYDLRKKQAFSGIAKLEKHYPEIQNARDISAEVLEQHKTELEGKEYCRLKHAVSERERVFAFMESMKKNDFETAGQLLNQTHQSLDSDYEVTCPELNLMQEAANSIDGCYGARMVGGGFGGCVVALVDQEHKSRFIEEVKKKYNSNPGIAPRKIKAEVWEAVSGNGLHIEDVTTGN